MFDEYDDSSPSLEPAYPIPVETDDEDLPDGGESYEEIFPQAQEVDMESAGVHPEDISYNDFKGSFDEIVAKIMDSLDSTWWLFGEENGMDDIMERGGAAMEHVPAQFGYRYFKNAGDSEVVFVCRYEWIRDGGDFRYPDGEDDNFGGDTCIYLDFLTGFPIDCVELLFMLGEYSSIYTAEEITKMDQGGDITPPLPERFFEGYEPDRILVNITALDRSLDKTYYGVHLMSALNGSTDARSPKWWLRVNINADDNFPIPGEFVGLGVRLMPGEVAGNQDVSPFIYAGNWIDYVYYTGAEILEIDESGDYPVYLVQWRKFTFEIKPSDYAIYEVGDRVTIMKNVDTDKVTQTWEDGDVQEYDAEQWVIVPVMFYGIEFGNAED